MVAGWDLEGTWQAPLCSLAVPSLEFWIHLSSPLNTLLQWGHRDAPLTPSKPVPGLGGMQDGWNSCPGRQEKAASPGSSFGLSPAEQEGDRQRSPGRLISEPLVRSNRHLRPQGSQRRNSPRLWQGSKEHPSHQPSCWPPPSASQQQRGEEQPKPRGGIWRFS